MTRTAAAARRDRSRHMTALKTISFVVSVMVITASAANAQQTRAATTTLEHGYMTAAAGAAFSDQKAAAFALEIGERIARRAEAYVAFTYFDNLLNDRDRKSVV